MSTEKIKFRDGVDSVVALTVAEALDKLLGDFVKEHAQGGKINHQEAHDISLTICCLLLTATRIKYSACEKLSSEQMSRIIEADLLTAHPVIISMFLKGKLPDNFEHTRSERPLNDDKIH